MKNINLLFLITILSSLPFLSCSDDPIDDNSGNTGQDSEHYEVNKWIENTMRDYYYWYSDIPKSVNYDYEPETFFMSLLSKKDGKPYTDQNGKVTGHHYYSYMESKTTTQRAAVSDNEFSLGFEFQYYYISNRNKNALKVLYILPDSPAAKSNLKRGDWIFTVNGQAISDDIVTNINNGTKTLGIAKGPGKEVTSQVTLSPATVEDNPVYFKNVYYREGRKIGYLVYNHFTSGKNDNDETYNNSLRKAFTEFKESSADEFILDLRYNRGGAVNCAQLLATLLAPSQALGNVFCNVTYNNKKSSNNYTYKFDTKYMQQGGYGANLNPKRLFVITSETTASASEAVINGLIPFMGNNLIIVGEQTEGKNVGSITLTDNKYDWKLHPIVCLISNKNNESDYEDGFLPTSSFECTDVHENMYDLGDENEYIFNKIFRYIAYNEPVYSKQRAIGDSDSTDAQLVLISSSLDRKATNGVLIK